MTDTTRRSFLRGLLASLAITSVPLASQAAPKKAPEIKKKAPVAKASATSPAGKMPPYESEKLVKLYMPLCEHLEGNMFFVYKDKAHPAIGCGVHFENFKEKIGNERAVKIVPKAGHSLVLNKKRLEQIVIADWRNPKTRALFPEVERVERVKLKDYKGECPIPKAKKWNKPLFWIPPVTLEKANRCAAEFCIQKAWELHGKNLLKIPPSARLVIVDLIYNLGDGGYNTFPKFQTAVNQLNLQIMKNECLIKENTRRNTVREWLMDSAILSRKNLSTKETVKKTMRNCIANDCKMSPRLEPGIWREIDKCTEENCVWGKAQNILIQRMCLTKGTAKKS